MSAAPFPKHFPKHANGLRTRDSTGAKPSGSPSSLSNHFFHLPSTLRAAMHGCNGNANPVSTQERRGTLITRCCGPCYAHVFPTALLQGLKGARGHKLSATANACRSCRRGKGGSRRNHGGGKFGLAGYGCNIGAQKSWVQPLWEGPLGQGRGEYQIEVGPAFSAAAGFKRANGILKGNVGSSKGLEGIGKEIDRCVQSRGSLVEHGKRRVMGGRDRGRKTGREGEGGGSAGRLPQGRSGRAGAMAPAAGY